MSVESHLKSNTHLNRKLRACCNKETKEKEKLENLKISDRGHGGSGAGNPARVGYCKPSVLGAGPVFLETLINLMMLGHSSTIF